LLPFGSWLLALVVAPAVARAGDSHGWAWKGAPGADALRATVAECLRLAEARTGAVKITRHDASSIVLDDAGDDPHESFSFPRSPFGLPDHPGFNSCKTGGHPYDEVVTACLLAARAHFPPAVLEIASDGSPEDWLPGVQLHQAVLGRAPPEPFAAPSAAGQAFDLRGPGFDIRSWLVGLLGIAALIYFLRGGAGGWGSYYLIWMVAPTLVAIVLSNPILLVVVLVGLVARRWLPDPYLVVKYAARIRSLDASVRANAENVTARRDLAVIWLAKRRPRKALPLVEQALGRDPDSTELRYLRGSCQLALGQWQAAVDSFIAVLEREPRFRYGDPYLRAADALLALERWPDAQDGLEQFLTINRSSLEPYLKLATARGRQGDATGARAALDTAKRTYHELPGFQRRRQLGWFLRAWARRAVA
jgi:hypothetical protein